MAIDVPDVGFDEQDVAETFDEENTNLEADLYSGRENPEVLEELPEVYDSTTAVGDEDDDAALIGDDLDDDEIVDLERGSDQDDADLEDDDISAREPEKYRREESLLDEAEVGDQDLGAVDGADDLESNEVELEYAGDLNDLEGAESAAQNLESSRLSDSQLRDLDYKDEYTVDEGDDDDDE